MYVFGGLHWVLVAVHRLFFFLHVASKDYSLVAVHRLLIVDGSLVVEHGF